MKEVSGSISDVSEVNRWEWERADVTRSGSSGDLAKLFKNEGVSSPAALAEGAPSPEATLMAREVIQNSSDAAAELQQDLGDAAPPFELGFDFREYVGASKADLIATLDLEGLRSQLGRPAGSLAEVRQALGLSTSLCLDHLEDRQAPLRAVVVQEHGTTGMYGPWIQTRSKLYLALVSVGYTRKPDGSGGSYGYGKAGLIAASATRTVVAYTCFREREDEPGVTRRLLGMTYWGQHTAGDDYTGFARFGRPDEAAPVPFVNQQADELASALGLDVRDPSNPSDLGTTFLLLDPVVEPEDLNTAITRSWWPALEQGRFEVDVVQHDADGHESGWWTPRPKSDPVLQSFVTAFEVATMAQDNARADQHRKALPRTRVDGTLLNTGMLGLVADLGGWSYAAVLPDDAESEVNHRSLVALIRGPRMVVEYFEAGKTVPYVRGAFLADDALDDLLRRSEPKAHDKWDVKKGNADSDDELALGVAGAVLGKIKDEVLEFRKRLKPPRPAPGDIRLPAFQELARKMSQGQGPPPSPPTPPRDVSIKVIKKKRVVAPDGQHLVLKSKVQVSLSDNFSGGDSSPVVVKIQCRFVEDTRVGQPLAVSIKLPEGFEMAGPGELRGVLTREPLVISAESEPYDSEWTVRLTAGCEIAKDPAGGQQ